MHRYLLRAIRHSVCLSSFISITCTHYSFLREVALRQGKGSFLYQVKSKATVRYRKLQEHLYVFTWQFHYRKLNPINYHLCGLQSNLHNPEKVKEMK